MLNIYKWERKIVTHVTWHVTRNRWGKVNLSLNFCSLAWEKGLIKIFSQTILQLQRAFQITKDIKIESLAWQVLPVWWDIAFWWGFIGMGLRLQPVQRACFFHILSNSPGRIRSLKKSHDWRTSRLRDWIYVYLYMLFATKQYFLFTLVAYKSWLGPALAACLLPLYIAWALLNWR